MGYSHDTIKTKGRWAERRRQADWAMPTLLRAGFSPHVINENGHSAAHEAALWDWPSMLEQLCAHGVDLERRSGPHPEDSEHRRSGGLTVLLKACQSSFKRDGDATILDVLERAGARLGACAENGNTALHFACLCESLEKVAWLLKRGADPEHCNKFGHSALDLVTDLSVREKYTEYYGSNLAAIQALLERHSLGQSPAIEMSTSSVGPQKARL